MISYAQNHEDVVLARLFRGQETGFYVDVGAGHPVEDSVTKHFSVAGWAGINVEPMEREHSMLCRDRPLDANVRAALSDRDGTATLYEAPLENRGASTLVAEVAQRYPDDVFTPVVVPTMTLAQVCEAHAHQPIDFMKIDVEGSELGVIQGGDWKRFRPRVLVIEATEPNSCIPSHEQWEPLVLDHGYRCALFDGLNRFYAQGGDRDALDVLSRPANVLDAYEPWRWVREIAGTKAYVESLQDEIASTKAYAESLQDEADKAQRHVEIVHEQIRALVEEARSLRRDPGGATD
jgi:FkbM family methyltransferase